MLLIILMSAVLSSYGSTLLYLNFSALRSKKISGINLTGYIMITRIKGCMKNKVNFSKFYATLKYIVLL